MAVETVRLESGDGIEVDITLVAGDPWEGIGVTVADPWNRGQAYELSRGVAWHVREGGTWDSSGGWQYRVVKNGEDETWKEV